MPNLIGRRLRPKADSFRYGLTNLTIDGARTAIQERKTTSMALAEAHYERIQKEDSAIGAYLTLTKERALEQADRMDRLADEGTPLPPLGRRAGRN